MRKFKSVFEHKQKILRNRPDKCGVEVHAQSRLVEDFRSHVKTRGFEVIVDQPENMGSSNQAPRPGEYVLAALAACHEVTWRLYADALDIDLQDIAVSVTGKSDARGFFDLGDDIPAGFSEVVGTIDVVSDASDEDLERLRLAVNRHCPVLDDLKRPVKVDLEVQRKMPDM